MFLHSLETQKVAPLSLLAVTEARISFRKGGCEEKGNKMK